MADQVVALSFADAERFRGYERRRHDSLAASYHLFFRPPRRDLKADCNFVTT